MPYIIGTAGHIDHGKTSLVKALTGQDTDRLKEEKERGISIDLGFACVDLPDGTRAGVVDVPGHERFIKNMLAGAHGIDLVLFTVAADDGVMPQSEEHLDILHVLGVQRAIFVITKCDLVPPARIHEVEEEIEILAAGSSLEKSPALAFSFVTGQGLPELRALIAHTLQTGEKPRPSGCFRLPVDRVFVLQGQGLVVTGTALAGDISVGDQVRCLPGGQVYRVRGLEVHNEPVDTGLWGQRIALNLSGAERPTIERGDVICHESLTMVSDRFDAALEIRPSASAGVKNHQRIRLHLGAAERSAKLILLGSGDQIGPKESGYCQIVLSEPIHALRGDHFVVRDETARRTLGGGVVLHPWATRHSRRDPDLRDRLKALHEGSFESVVAAFLDEGEELALPLEPICQFVNLEIGEASGRLDALDGIRGLAFEGERLYGTQRKWGGARKALLDALCGFHAAHPLAPGMEMEELRGRMPYQMTPRVFRAFVEQLEQGKAVARDANVVRRPEHTARLGDDDRSVVARVTTLLGGSPLAPPELKDIERDLGIGSARLNEVMRLLEREGAIVRVAGDLYFLRQTVENVRGVLCDYLSKKSQITPGAFRDLFGTSRKYTIPLLEYFDRTGITVRVGDSRRLKHS